MRIKMLNIKVERSMKKGLYDVVEQNGDIIKIKVDNVICQIQNGVKKVFYKVINEETNEAVYVGTLY